MQSSINSCSILKENDDEPESNNEPNNHPQQNSPGGHDRCASPYVNLSQTAEKQNAPPTITDYNQSNCEFFNQNEDENDKSANVFSSRTHREVGAAYFDYVARENDELSLQRGSVVEIIQRDCGEEGWMLARVDNREGMVPKNYVIMVGSQPDYINNSDVVVSNKLIGDGGFANVYQGTFKGNKV